MDNIVTKPTIVSDPIVLLQLVHQENVGYPIGDVPHLQLPVVPSLVHHHCIRVAIEFDASLNGLHILHELVALEGRHCQASVEIGSIVRELSPL
jgi:hypothetical protein